MTKMSESLATEVLTDDVDVKDRKIDPMTLILVASILIELVKLYIECKKSKEDAVVISQSSGVLENRIVKRQLRRRMGTAKYLTQGGPRLANQIIKRATRITPDEMEKLYEEATE